MILLLAAGVVALVVLGAGCVAFARAISAAAKLQRQHDEEGRL